MTSVPTMVRTIEWRNALPFTVMATARSPITSSCEKEISCTFRQVGFPTALAAMQKLLKSCSPISARDASRIASTSSGFGICHEKSRRKMGGAGSVQMK